MATSATAVINAHWFSLVATTVLLLITIVMLWKQKREAGPFLLVIFAAPLVMINPVMNLGFDYQRVTETRTLVVLVNLLTWLGTIQLMTGTLWHSGITMPACISARCLSFRSSAARMAEVKAKTRDAL